MADVRQFSDAEINRLVKFYEQAEREILDRINRALLRGNQTEYLQAMKQNVEAILQQLREGNRTWCTEAIPRVYSEGLRNADIMLKDIGASTSAAFGAIHQQAAQVLAENTYQRLEDVVQVIGRQVNDIYRELALENVRGTVVGYDTWKQTARRFREQLAERGVTGFKDRSGRMWNMRRYAEMVARTTTMEAHLQGTANRLVEQGHDLIKVSTHRGACPLCEPWQGKILSITGKTEGYPTLEEAKAAGLFHPNCRHAYGLYIDLDKEIEELEAEERGIDRETPIITTKDFDEEITDRIKASEHPSNLMLRHEYEEIFLKKGFTREEIETVKKLLSDYGGVAAQQKKAMETIAAEIKNDSRIGKLLRATSDLEEAAVEIWQSGLEDRIKKAIKAAKEDWDLFGQAEGFSKDFSDFSEVETAIRMRLEKEASLVVYRKGDLGRPIESWTTDPLGADIGGGRRLTPDHAMTLSEMHKRGYKILGGTCRMMGSPGEMEITFINFDKCLEELEIGLEAGETTETELYNDSLLKEIKASVFEKMSKEYSAEYKEKFTNEEHEAILKYQGSGYLDMNRFLRGELESASKELRTYITNLQKAIKKVKIKENILVARGTTTSAIGGDWNNIQINDTIIDEGFMSTSLREETATVFIDRKRERGILMYVKIPKGTNGVIVDVAVNDSWESELLLEPGTKIRITGKRIENGMRIVEGVVVNE